MSGWVWIDTEFSRGNVNPYEFFPSACLPPVVQQCCNPWCYQEMLCVLVISSKVEQRKRRYLCNRAHQIRYTTNRRKTPSSPRFRSQQTLDIVSGHGEVLIVELVTILLQFCLPPRTTVLVVVGVEKRGVHELNWSMGLPGKKFPFIELH